MSSNADASITDHGQYPDAAAELNPSGAETWIVMGDIHGRLRCLPGLSGLSEAAGVIITGDLTRLGGINRAREVIEAIHEYNPVVLAQFGNMDRSEVDDWLTGQGINLHCTVRELAPDTAIIGVGGSIFTPFGTPSEFPDSRYAAWLEDLANRAAGYKNIILISHNPPYDTVCDKLSGGGNAGSRAIREFIEEYQPVACLCGHIHESVGQQLVGKTIVANPGTFMNGGYLRLTLAKNISAELCQVGL